MKIILLICVFIMSLEGKFIDELSYTIPKFVSTKNYSDFIPNPYPSVIFYYIQNPKIRMDAQILNMAIENYQNSNKTNINFYRIEGPYNPEIILQNSLVTEYPSLVYYPPFSTEISEFFTEDWKTSHISKWLNNLPNSNKTLETSKENIICKNLISRYNNLSNQIQTQSKILSEISVNLNSSQNISYSHNSNFVSIISLFIGISIGFIVFTLINYQNSSKFNKTP